MSGCRLGDFSIKQKAVLGKIKEKRLALAYPLSFDEITISGMK